MKKMQNGQIFATNAELAKQLGFAYCTGGKFGVFFTPKKAVPAGAASSNSEEVEA